MIREGTGDVWLWKQNSRLQSFQSALQDKVSFYQSTSTQIHGSAEMITINKSGQMSWLLEAYANEHLSHLGSTNPREATQFVKQE